MDTAGLLRFRYELMDGILLRKPPRYLREAGIVSNVLFWFGQHLGWESILPGCGLFVAPDESDLTCPVPDITILNKPGRTIPGNYPRPEDIRLVVEVSDTTLDYDLKTKAGVYMRAGIAQYFVIDVNGRVVYEHILNPATGGYDRETRNPGDALTLLAAPHLPLTVDDWLLP